MIAATIKWNARLIVIGIFILGFAGGAVTIEAFRANTHSGSLFSSHPKSVKDSNLELERLTQGLNLTEQQLQQVQGTLEEMRIDLDRLRLEVRPRFHAIRQGSRNKIRALLTPKQQIKFDQMMQQYDDERNKLPK